MKKQMKSITTFMITGLILLIMLIQSMSQAADKTSSEKQISCKSFSDESILSCLNHTLIPSLLIEANKVYVEELVRLMSVYDLKATQEDLNSFMDKFGKVKSIMSEEEVSEPSLAVSGNNRSALSIKNRFTVRGITVVDPRTDGSGANFDLKAGLADFILSLGGNFDGVPGKLDGDELVQKNILESLKFVAYFHARNFGKKNGLLFNFNRVEISAENEDSNEGLLALDGKVLRINLPQDEVILAGDLLENWNEGQVLLTRTQDMLPRSLLSLAAKFGSMEQKAGMFILDHWNMFNPISDFRVQMSAIFHRESKSLLKKIANMTEQQVLDFINKQLDPALKEDRQIISNLQSYENIKASLVKNISSSDNQAQSFDSLFDISSANGKSGDINVINRFAGFCLIKVSNSHVIRIDWNESNFATSKEVASVTIDINDDKVKVTGKSDQNIHVVNDRVWLAGLCVDTNDNVQVNLNNIISQFQKRMKQKNIIQMAINEMI